MIEKEINSFLFIFDMKTFIPIKNDTYKMHV